MFLIFGDYEESLHKHLHLQFFANISSSLWPAFLLAFSFKEKKLLIKLNLIRNFFFYILSRKSLCNSVSPRSFTFYSKIFIVSTEMYVSDSLKINFVYMTKKKVQHFCIWMSNSFCTIDWKGYSFPTNYLGIFVKN